MNREPAWMDPDNFSNAIAELQELRAEVERLKAALKLARQYMPMGAEIYDDDIQKDIDVVEAALGSK